MAALKKKTATPAKKTKSNKAVKKPVKKTAAKPAAKKPAKKSVTKKPAKESAKKPAAKKPAKKPAAKKLTKKPVKKPAAKPKTLKKPSVTLKDEEYMSQQHLDYFEQLFEKMRTDILSNNERLVDAIKSDVHALPDENDRASKESEFTVELRERERERRLLNKINYAIKRLENNNFGYCTECANPIGIKRLIARPVATLCIECKSLQEAFEKSGANE